ncbi:hypothetical protein RHMOL_Rhmol12G0108600 [Rhododendron molle]|uniref:Uncharacterized protein n=1 Tax=Rhododendron molle TaxID=49168 RepID=A0ACC0LGY9_RHOML|nr:hypothetical protein RHMOL_Rhmol12G0108600 [Rhododendron molle]
MVPTIEEKETSLSSCDEKRAEKKVGIWGDLDGINRRYQSPLQNSWRRPQPWKMKRSISTPQRTESSLAFFMRPLRRSEKET